MTKQSSARGGAALVALVALTLFGPLTATAQISVIVSASSTNTASGSDLADMFAGATTTWSDGTKVQIVDHPSSPVAAQFYSEFVGQSIAQVRTQWTRLVLSGQALAPKRVNDVAAVKRTVIEFSGAVGYIPTSALDDTVRELTRIN